MISWWTGPFIIHDVQSNGVVELLNFKSTQTFKLRENKENMGEKPRPSEISTTNSLCEIAPPYPLCEIAFVTIFQKHALECENFRLHYSPCAKFALVL
ncbi:hypothetical protein AAG906_012173 [Vitis piasezkii]